VPEPRSGTPDPGPPSPSKPVLWTLLFTSTLTVMAGAIIAPSLPVMRDVFEEVAWVGMGVRLVLTMPALFIVLGAPLAGWIADRYGRRRLLVGAILLYALAGGAGLILSTLGGLLASRALLGVAVAGVMTAVTTLIGDYYRGMERARILGAQAAFMGLGGVVFTTGGGLLAALHWRGPFGVYPAALLILPAVLRLLHEPKREGGAEVPVPPGAVPVGGVGIGGAGASEALAEAGDRVPSPPGHPGGSAASPRPVGPSGPGFGLSVALPVFVVAFLVQLVFYTIPVQLPFHLQTLSGSGPRTAGLAIAACSLFFSLGSFVSARLSKGWSHAGVVARGFVLTAVGFGVVGAAPGLGVLFPGLAVAGFGMGLILPAMSVWLNTEVPSAMRGRAMGGFTTAIFLGQFLSPIASQPLLALGGPAAAYLGIAVALPVVAGLLFLSGKVGKASAFSQGAHRPGE
jgi:MFS family permease